MEDFMRIEERKREHLWWMNENEESLHDGSKLEEAYDPKRLKPGYDGRNGPDVKTLYAKKGEARFDKLGANGGDNQEVSKPKKGAADTKDLSVKERRMREFEDEEGMDNLEGEGMGGEGIDDDVPPEMEEPMDDEFGDEEGMEGEGEGGDEVADEVTVEIQGQRFKLVPEEPEEGMEGDEFGDEEFGDEGGQGLNTEPPPMGQVEPEDDDVEFPEAAPRKRVMKESAKSKKEKANYVRKLLKMKDFAESELKELFTGDYVVTKDQNGGLAGMNFKPVTGDTKYAVVARAATGDQYTVTDSKSPYEPGSDSKGQTGGGKVNKLAAPTVESFKKWLQSTYLNEEEVGAEDGQNDPGKDSQDFNKEDLFGQVTPISPLDPKDYPAQPEMVGMGNPGKQSKQDANPVSDTTVMTMAKTARAGESTTTTKARLEAVKRARVARRQQESAIVKPDGKVSVLDEELDFKKLMNGDYSHLSE
jgi:hypothetical protein